VHAEDLLEPHAAREQLVKYSVRLLDDGLAVGSAGNISVRVGAGVAITPSGIGYRELQAGDICMISLDGTEPAPAQPSPAAVSSAPASPAAVPSFAVPSSEAPMHLAIYAATGAAAVVHSHSPEVIALSCSRDELPAIHYAITGLGGPVRIAPYTRFGSEALARGAVQALAGRQAAILQNHGAITYGRTLAEAYDRALLLEWLARIYRLACSHGTPRILTAAELAEVTAEAKRRRYGQGRRPGGGQLR
jgi:L-fuculose-phosphate aldolase